jgi:hypothetical protein
LVCLSNGIYHSVCRNGIDSSGVYRNASETEPISPASDASAVSLLLSAAATCNVTLAISTGGGEGTTSDDDSAGLAFECFTPSGVEAGGRDGKDAADSAAFDFFAFSVVEAEVIKGADC